MPGLLPLVNWYSPVFFVCFLNPAAKLEDSLLGSASWRAIDDSVAVAVTAAAGLDPSAEGEGCLQMSGSHRPQHQNNPNSKRNKTPKRSSSSASSSSSPRDTKSPAQSSFLFSFSVTRLPFFWVGFVLILVSGLHFLFCSVLFWDRPRPFNGLNPALPRAPAALVFLSPPVPVACPKPTTHTPPPPQLLPRTISPLLPPVGLVSWYVPCGRYLYDRRTLCSGQDMGTIHTLADPAAPCRSSSNLLFMTPSYSISHI